MLRRTNGIILLTLLVVTGLAGRLFSNTISSKERRLLIDNLKESKSYLQKTIKGFSEEQLNFKPGPEKWSIKECVQHIALSEKNLWGMVDGTLRNSANPEKRTEIKMTDEQIGLMIKDRSHKVQTSETLKPEQSTWKSMEEAMEAFKDNRNALIKYAKTSTHDMRNHVGQTPLGYLDVYQMILLISGHTKRHTMQIEEIKADPRFPN
jgi:hypothetical protein